MITSLMLLIGKLGGLSVQSFGCSHALSGYQHGATAIDAYAHGASALSASLISGVGLDDYQPGATGLGACSTGGTALDGAC